MKDVAEDVDVKVTPAESVPNLKPARGRPRKVLCNLMFCSLCTYLIC